MTLINHIDILDQNECYEVLRKVTDRLEIIATGKAGLFPQKGNISKYAHIGQQLEKKRIAKSKN